MCKVKLQHNKRQKKCKFFVVLGNGQALLDMPDIDTLNIITINLNTICTPETDRVDECSKNTTIHQDLRHGQHYTNIMLESNRAKECCVNTNTISKFKNKDKSAVIDNKPNKGNYFLSGPSQENYMRISAEITEQLQRDFNDVFTGIG